MTRNGPPFDCYHRGMQRDPIELEIFKNLYHSIAEEMGAALRRTAFSPNIKERRDYSCAVFDGEGQVIAMGDHMPVHLGSMPMSVRAAIEACAMEPGDVVMLNDPFRGGTHLPDITLVAPVYVRNGRTRGPLAYTPGFLRCLARPSCRRWRNLSGIDGPLPGDLPGRSPHSAGQADAGGKMDRDVLALLLNNVRTPEEREGDLGAQIAACHTGAAASARNMRALRTRTRAARAAADLLEYSEEIDARISAAASRGGSYRAEDFLDNDGISDQPDQDRSHDQRSPKLSRKPAREERSCVHMVTVDFTGSDPQVEGSVNAVEAITYSACFYVFRCLLARGRSRYCRPHASDRGHRSRGTVVNARPPAAVAGGNVETSQRIVDVLLKALAQAIPDRIPAAASGTMNNLTIGGIDPRTGEPFAYYETIAGGMGARPRRPAFPASIRT